MNDEQCVTKSRKEVLDTTLYSELFPVDENGLTQAPQVHHKADDKNVEKDHL